MSEVKSKQLGMSFSTASGQLRKQIMFMLVQKSGLDTCHQCKEKIEDIDNFSIEHIEPWLHSEDPVKLFFDLENIAFSHHKCNVRAARRPEEQVVISADKQLVTTSSSKSGFLGVYQHNKKKSYQVRLYHDGKPRSFGYYKTPEEAARVADEKIIEFRGPTANTNKSLGLI